MLEQDLPNSTIPFLFFSSLLFKCEFVSFEFNPLTSKRDWTLISLYSITPESHIKVMRIKEMIHN